MMYRVEALETAWLPQVFALWFLFSFPFVVLGCSTTPELSTRKKDRETSETSRQKQKKAGKRYLEQKKFLKAWPEFYEIEYVPGLRRCILGAMQDKNVTETQTRDMIRRFRELGAPWKETLAARIRERGTDSLERGNYKSAWFYFSAIGDRDRLQRVLQKARRANVEEKWVKEKEDELKKEKEE